MISLQIMCIKKHLSNYSNLILPYYYATLLIVVFYFCHCHCVTCCGLSACLINEDIYTYINSFKPVILAFIEFNISSPVKSCNIWFLCRPANIAKWKIGRIFLTQAKNSKKKIVNSMKSLTAYQFADFHRT